MDDEEKNDGVHLERRTLTPGTKWDLLQDPTLVYPIGHDTVDYQGGRDGSTFKVLALPGVVLWQDGDSDVEARKAKQTTEDKKCKAASVEKTAKTDRESHHGRSNTESDLCITQLVALSPAHV